MCHKADNKPAIFIMSDNFQIITEGEVNKDRYQEALSAIQSDQMDLAHQMLLGSLRTYPDDIQLWLLLGWTAPTSESAAFYFQHVMEEHPDNPLPLELLKVKNQKFENTENQSGLSAGNIGDVIASSTTPYAESDEQVQVSDNPVRLMDRQVEEIKTRFADRQTPLRKTNHLNTLKKLRIPLIYLAALTMAEALTTLANPRVGLIFHGFILGALILHATLFAKHGLQKFLITMTLAPLIRLMSLSMPLLQFPFIYWYALIGAPLILAGFLVLRVTGYKADRIGLNMRALPWQLLIALTGIAFGFMEYLILKPTPLEGAQSWDQILMPAMILLIFTGFLEEFIFRGLIQRGALGTVGHYALVYVAVLFAVLHLGYRSLWDLVFVFAVGMFFGVVVLRTGSLLGVTLSHGLTNITLYLIIPLLMNASANPMAAKIPNSTAPNSSSQVWVMEPMNLGSASLDEDETRFNQIKIQPGIIESNSDKGSIELNFSEQISGDSIKKQPKDLNFSTGWIKDDLIQGITTLRPVRS